MSPLSSISAACRVAIILPLSTGTMRPSTSVLIVDDEPAVRGIMARWAASLGLEPRQATNADEALAAVNEEPCDLAVIDVVMPGQDGLWLANKIRQEHPEMALVLATAYTSLLRGDEDVVDRLADLLVKPIARERFALAVDRGKRWKKETEAERLWEATLLRHLGEQTSAICDEVRRRVEAGASEFDALIAIATERTGETMAHSERVTRFAVSVGREMKLDRRQLGRLELAAQLHDVGKAAIPDAILNKPSALTPSERALMQRHLDTGGDILASTHTLGELADLVLSTHERFDGAGYPRQLSGQDIPLIGRIIAVVDAYDAMTQQRAYRGRLTSAEAVGELLRCSATQFDPDVVMAFLSVLAKH